MKPRTTIFKLMLVVALAAIGSVAIRGAKDIGAASAFTLVLGVLGLSCLGAPAPDEEIL